MWFVTLLPSPMVKLLIFNAVVTLEKKSSWWQTLATDYNYRFWIWTILFSWWKMDNLCQLEWYGDGALYKLNLTDRSKTGELNIEKAMYRTPSFFSWWQSIVYTKEQGTSIWPVFLPQGRVYMISSTGGKGVFVNDKGEYPTFNACRR